jgi:hypothetical protein
MVGLGKAALALFAAVFSLGEIVNVSVTGGLVKTARAPDCTGLLTSLFTINA